MHYRRPVTEAVMTRGLWSGPGEGEHIWFLGSLVTIKVPGDAVDGRCAMLEFLMPRGVSPPRHYHQSDELFTMLEGELTFVAGDQRFTGEPGSDWVVPGGVPHTFRVESETARLVAVYAPAGRMEDCFRKAGLPADTATLPPPDAPARPMEVIEEVMRTHDHHNVGPPLGPDD
jgi:quercetin dioxygenase-like cupin family protein